MRLDEIRVKNWLLHFSLIQKESDWNDIHVSGHGSGDQIKRIIETTRSRKVIPIHTEHEGYHYQEVIATRAIDVSMTTGNSSVEVYQG
jgi:mRNA degradation ribonuclease J1/J2